MLETSLKQAQTSYAEPVNLTRRPEAFGGKTRLKHPMPPRRVTLATMGPTICPARDLFTLRLTACRRMDRNPGAELIISRSAIPADHQLGRIEAPSGLAHPVQPEPWNADRGAPQLHVLPHRAILRVSPRHGDRHPGVRRGPASTRRHLSPGRITSPRTLRGGLAPPGAPSEATGHQPRRLGFDNPADLENIPPPPPGPPPPQPGEQRQAPRAYTGSYGLQDGQTGHLATYPEMVPGAFSLSHEQLSLQIDAERRYFRTIRDNAILIPEPAARASDTNDIVWT